MAALVLACLILGVAPSLFLAPLDAAVFDLVGNRADLQFNLIAIAAGREFGWVAPLSIALALFTLLLAIPLALRLLGANRHRRAYETWGCGRALQTARFEYTATAFANPFKRVFAPLYRPVKDLEIEFHPESRYFVRTIAYCNESRLIFEEALYGPLLRTIQALARAARVLQSGNVHGYLVYILAALVALLVVAV
jgi:hypothetical protein